MPHCLNVIRGDTKEPLSRTCTMRLHLLQPHQIHIFGLDYPNPFSSLEGENEKWIGLHSYLQFLCCLGNTDIKGFPLTDSRELCKHYCSRVPEGELRQNKHLSQSCRGSRRYRWAQKLCQVLE